MDIQNIFKNHKKLSISLGIIILLLIILPMGVKYAAMSWLKKNNAENILIDDVDINLFAGRVGIEGFSIGSDSGGKIHVDELRLNISMLSLLRGRFYVESFKIDGLDCVIVQKPELLLMGIPIALTKESDESSAIEEKKEETSLPAFGIGELLFKHLQIQYHGPALSVKADINTLTLAELLSWDKNSQAHLILNSAINDSPLNMDLNLALFSEPRTVEADIKLDELPLESFEKIAEAYVSNLGGTLDIHTKLSITLSGNEDLNLTQNGDFLVNNIKAAVDTGSGDKIQIDDMDLSWKGNITADIVEKEKLSGLTIKGELNNGHFLGMLVNPEIHIAHDGLKWQGTVKSNSPDLMKNMQTDGNLGLQQFVIKNDPIGIEIFSLKDMKVESIAAKNLDDIQIGPLLLQHLSIATPYDKHKDIPERLVKNDEISVKNIKITDQSNLVIDDIVMKNMDVSIYRNKEGDIPLIKMLSQISLSTEENSSQESGPKDLEADESHKTADISSKGNTEDRHPEQSETKRPLINIHSIYFSGANHIQIFDESVTPKYEQQISIETFRIENIDNSSLDNSINIFLDAKFDKHSLIAVQGQAKPFYPEISLTTTGKIKNVDLSKLSPYSSTYLGYNIKTGALSGDVECKVDAGELLVNDKIIMNNIKLSPDDQEKIDQLSKQFTMPLDYALSIIRDKNNDVILEIPVSGDVENPDFNFNDIVKIAMKKALKKASMSIVKNLLQPYGSLITATKLAVEGGKYITKIRLDPVVFPVGSVDDLAGVSDYLSKVKQILVEKPDMRLTICGKTVPGDLPDKNVEENKDDFLSVAKQRSQVIQDYFVDQGISADRLFLCNPEVDLSDNALPRVELSL